MNKLSFLKIPGWFKKMVLAMGCAWTLLTPCEAKYGGVLTTTHSHYGNTIVNVVEIKDEWHFYFDIKVDATTTDGDYRIDIYHRVPWGEPNIKFTVRDGAMVSRTGAEKFIVTGGTPSVEEKGAPWNIQISGPMALSEWILTYHIADTYIWTYYFLHPAFPRHERSTPNISQKTITIDLRQREAKTPPDCDAARGISEDCGMAQASLNPQFPGLHVTDIPLTYRPAFGPVPSFLSSYSDAHPSFALQDETLSNVNPPRPTSMPIDPFVLEDPMALQLPYTAATHLGRGWALALLSSVTGGLADNSAEALYYEAGYGKERYQYYQVPPGPLPAGALGPTSATYPVQTRSRSTLQFTAANGGLYERVLPDGSKQSFGKLVQFGARKTYFITRQTDPQGNSLTYQYDPDPLSARLLSLTDATGKMTTFSYEHSTDLNRLTRITDPYGRYASYGYDPAGRLNSIIDPVGIESSFYYNSENRITQLSTPYGNTSVDRQFAPAWRLAELTQPDGSKERAEFFSYVDPALTLAGAVPSANELLINQANLNRNVSFIWDRKAMAEAAKTGHPSLSLGSYPYAQQIQWLQVQDRSTDRPASIKPYGQSRIWFNYKSPAGTTFQNVAPDIENAVFNPTAIARLNENGAEVSRASYNNQGNLTSKTDPLNRKTGYEYAANGIDLLNVKQIIPATPTEPEQSETLQTIIYHPLFPRLPKTLKDAAGNNTELDYYPNGQLHTVTNALGELTIYGYNTLGQLTTLTEPLNKITTLTWNKGMPSSITPSDGLTVEQTYDNLDRPLKTTHLDNTYSQVIYNKLDAEWMRDREGRWSRTTHNSIRQVSATQDPLGRLTNYEWCKCGALQKLTDALGRVTNWSYDAGGRLLDKTYPDGTKKIYAYETTTSRVKSVTDALNQRTNFEYYVDNQLKKTSYTTTAGAALSPTTPSVEFTYDTNYGRLASMLDGTGLTSYAYHPITATPSLGAGKLASVDGPLANDLLAYAYDELGRVSGQAIHSVAETVLYDVLGRVPSVTNPLGTTSFNYVNQTNRLASQTLPNGVMSSFNYYNNLGDQRLQQIKHQTSAAALISQFDYTYSATGKITQWQQNQGTPETWKLGYDRADQLTSVNKATLQEDWSYDKAGNAVLTQVNNQSQKGSFNNLNQLTSLGTGDRLKVRGITSEPSNVYVNHQVATMTDATHFEHEIPVTSGSNTFKVEAQDGSGNRKTQNYQVSVTSPPAKVFSYDLNGNMTSDGTRTYAWDAANRLTKISYSGGGSSEFFYNGLSQRTRITEKDSSNAITKDSRFMWDGGNQPAQERDASGATVLKHYYNQGVYVPAAAAPLNKLYYTKDHLQSVREVTDALGNVVARYAYAAFGKRTKLSGSVDVDVGYTGHFHHVASGLILTQFRPYDAEFRIWLSQDPLGELISPNLYGYVGNNPVNGTDPLGLDVFFNQENEPGGHAWTKIGGDKPTGRNGYGQYPNGDLFGTPSIISNPDPHSEDDDFSYEQYTTTPEDEAALEKYIRDNYDINDYESKRNPKYHLGVNNCRSFNQELRGQLEKIIKNRGGKINKSTGKVPKATPYSK